METFAYFENINSVIDQELLKANNSIKVAVAWFTDRKLFDRLLFKAGEGNQIELIIVDDDINNNSGLDYSLLGNYERCRVWKVDTKVVVVL